MMDDNTKKRIPIYHICVLKLMYFCSQTHLHKVIKDNVSIKYIATLYQFPLNNATTKWIINVIYLSNMLQRENHVAGELTAVNSQKTKIQDKIK